MAISAYGSGGRLKKHALLGSSLATDPGRIQTRKRFRSLYDEARQTTGLGRSSMRDRLQGRFQQFGMGQQRRIKGIETQRTGLEREYQGAADSAKEAGFANYNKYIGTGGNQATWAQLTGRPSDMTSFETTLYYDKRSDKPSEYGLDRDYLTKAVEDFKKTGGWTDSSDDFKTIMQTSARTQHRDPRGWGEAMRKKNILTAQNETNMTKFLRDRLAQDFGPGSQKAYQQTRTDLASRIDETYIPLREEARQRLESLADRKNLYNMFLGV